MRILSADLGQQDGIFDALAKSYLAAVQLSVILEKNKPENVIETYTFAFRYTTNPLTSELQLGDLELSSSNGKAATIRSARSGIRMLSRHLVGLVQGLPDLPGSAPRLSGLLGPVTMLTHVRVPFRHSSSTIWE